MSLAQSGCAADMDFFIAIYDGDFYVFLRFASLL